MLMIAFLYGTISYGAFRRFTYHGVRLPFLVGLVLGVIFSVLFITVLSLIGWDPSLTFAFPNGAKSVGVFAAVAGATIVWTHIYTPWVSPRISKEEEVN